MNDKKNKKIIKRQSFKHLDWICKYIFLNFKIYDDFTIVESKLFLEKSKISKIRNLVLNGCQLNTLKFKIIYIFQNNKNKTVSYENTEKTRSCANKKQERTGTATSSVINKDV